MAATAIPGVQTTTSAAGGSGILAAQRVVDMSDVIHLLDPNEAPLTAISMKLRSRVCINPRFDWLEDEYLPTTDVTAATAATNGTQLTMTNGAYFRVGDVIKDLNTGETMYVRVVASNTLDVTRDLLSSSSGATDGVGTAVGSGDTVVIIGNANVENSSNRTIKTTLKVNQFNYTQIFRWEFGASGTLMASELYGGDALPYETKVAGKQFRIQLERAYMFGARNEITVSAASATGVGVQTGVMRFTGGIINRITTTVRTSTEISIANMELFMADLFRYGPPRRMLFASRANVSRLSLVGSAKIQTRPTDESFPLRLTEWVSPHGSLYIVTHNQLGPEAVGTTLNYGGWMLGLDIDNIYHRHLRGRNTMLRTNIQANDADGRIDGYLAECGVQLIEERNHAAWNSISATA